jgi:hypothetical protein
MILALAVFIANDVPVGASAWRAPFSDMAACRRFIAQPQPEAERDRMILEMRTGASVRVILMCHDLGRDA